MGRKTKFIKPGKTCTIAIKLITNRNVKICANDTDKNLGPSQTKVMP